MFLATTLRTVPPPGGGAGAGRLTAGRRRGRRLGLGDLLVVPRLEVGRRLDADVEQHDVRWPMPHSSAHWPWNVWPASLASIVRSNSLMMARHDVALEQELRDVEGVDDVGARQGEVDRLAGRQGQAAVGRERRRTPRRPGRRSPWRRGEVVERPLELAGDGPDEEVGLRSTWPRRVFSVCHEMTNRKRTMTVGTTVQMISARLLPWVWGGSSSSPGLRR